MIWRSRLLIKATLGNERWIIYFIIVSHDYKIKVRSDNPHFLLVYLGMVVLTKKQNNVMSYCKSEIDIMARTGLKMIKLTDHE